MKIAFREDQEDCYKLLGDIENYQRAIVERIKQHEQHLAKQDESTVIQARELLNGLLSGFTEEELELIHFRLCPNGQGAQIRGTLEEFIFVVAELIRNSVRATRSLRSTPELTKKIDDFNEYARNRRGLAYATGSKSRVFVYCGFEHFNTSIIHFLIHDVAEAFPNFAVEEVSRCGRIASDRKEGGRGLISSLAVIRHRYSGIFRCFCNYLEIQIPTHFTNGDDDSRHPPSLTFLVPEHSIRPNRRAVACEASVVESEKDKGL